MECERALYLRYAAKYLTIEHDPYHPPAWVVASLATLFVVFELYRATLRLYAEERSKREELEQRAIPHLRPQSPNRRSPYPRASIQKPPTSCAECWDNRGSSLLGSNLKIEFAGNRPEQESTLVIMEHAHLTLSWVHRDQQEIDISPQTVEMMEYYEFGEHERTEYIDPPKPSIFQRSIELPRSKNRDRVDF